jgi:hypothetical protein
MGQLLHKFPGETAILGQICTKTANFTPDLGSTEENKAHSTVTLSGSLLTHLSPWSAGFTAVSTCQPENFTTNANPTNDEPDARIVGGCYVFPEASRGSMNL